MAFKMKGNPMRRNFGIGAKPGDQEIKSPDEIRDEASKEVVMDGALDKSVYKKYGDKKPKSRASSTRTSKGGPFDKDENALKDPFGWFSNDEQDENAGNENAGNENAGNEESTGGPKTRDEAFAAARKDGKATFTWEGKEYHTRQADETKEEWQKEFNTDLPSPGETPEEPPAQETAPTEEPPAEEPPATEEGTASPEVDRPDYQKRRQEARIARRRKKGGKSDTYDIRTDKKEARMKYGRGSEEFKKYKQELKDAKAAKRQERRDNS